VLIVSALLHDPEIIFMDEPLTGLDANAVILLKEVISSLRQEGKTILYCSHIMDVVEKISDRIILIKDGRIMADGSMEALRAQAQTQSLEDIFARLTERGPSRQQGADFISAFKTKDT
jgi:ABC-2 type transport system ATP-binding protein